MSWNLQQLTELLAEQGQYVVTQEEHCLLIANEDGIDAWLAISGEQILVESLLFAVSEVTDTKALNDEILRTHMIFPLTTVGISTVGNEDYYTAFGSLSAQSKAESVLIEIETLFQNVAGFLDAYQSHLSVSV
ncbi:YjfI family protein [Alteromonas flava]|uniref:YjfI family protein n=1 Tax=Alteromonas flava TaxID=2048003 RepID=UPI000C28A1CE|nr:YjfI family protein [Alteromonas flava]